MKILYLANVRLPTTNAHGLQIAKMCEAFSLSGSEVTLLLPRRLNNIQEDIFSYYGLKNCFQVKVLPTPDLNNWGRIGFWLQNLVFSVLAVIYTFKNKDFDIIFSRDEYPLFFLSFFNKKLVWEIHVNRFNCVIKSLTSRVLGIVSISRGLKNFLVEKGVAPDKILVSPDAVDLSLFERMPKDKKVLRAELKLPLEKSLVAYVGKYTTMNKDKGVDSLIEAFSFVQDQVKNSLLLLVGINEKEIPDLKTKIEQVGLSPENYLIVTHRPHEEAMKFVKASDVLVMNYPNKDHYALYMSPLKLFEYMASGNVIVSTSLPSIKEILSEKEAYFVEPGDVEDLGRNIVQSLKKCDDSNLKAQRAYDLVHKYTWRARVSQILNFIGDMNIVEFKV